MPFLKRGAASGGQGGGLLLRTPADVFTEATRAAAETARDAAITDTGPFDDNPNLAIILAWPATPTNTVYQVRRGSAWADVTVVVRGPRGDGGAQGRFDVFCYANAATAPATPAGGTYNLDTGVLAVPAGTTAAPVETPANQFAWVSRATINPRTQTGSVVPTWSAFTTDVEASLADRAEAAQTAAEAAQTAAETAQTAAGTAQTGAETAQTAAEAAEGRAEAAQSGAETALASSGAALAFNELWTGDLLLATANQWHAIGTEAVPANATWLLWNGGTLTDGANDGPAALWTWINAADWRALTADTVGTTPGDGTGMLFADWCASDIGDGTPDFTRRDAVIGRTSADIPLLTGPQTGESYFGARLMYITQAVATPGGGDGASSFSELSGMIADSQIPDSIMRDAEFTAAAVRALLNLTETEVNDLFTGASISGGVLTFTQNDGTTATITVPPGADGVVTAGALSGTMLTLTVNGATDVLIDLGALRDGVLEQTGSGFNIDTGTLTLARSGILGAVVITGFPTSGGGTPTPAQTEQIYYGVIDAPADAETVAVGDLSAESAVVAGHNITLGPTAEAGDYFLIMVPVDHVLVSLINQGTQANALSAYTRALLTRQLGDPAEAYYAYTLGPLNDGVSITYQLILTE